MKLASFYGPGVLKHFNNNSRVCILIEKNQTIINLASKQFENSLNGIVTMNDLIDNNSQSLVDSANSSYTKNYFMENLIGIYEDGLANKLPAETMLSISNVKISAPIPVPKRNIICVGKNYKDHVKEIAAASKDNPSLADIPQHPVFFTKAPQCVIGPNDYVLSHKNLTSALDYEGELAVVIGKQGVNISVEDAYDYIFGYSIGNDVTARDLQKKHNQWFKGKSLDTCCPMGPVIVPKEFINNNGSSDFSDNHNLNIKLTINGEVRQNGNTNNMIFNISNIISRLSQGFTLQPGDIILTGTPDGVGYAMKPPKLLKNGDVMRIEIDGIGSLTNTVIDELKE